MISNQQDIGSKQSKHGGHHHMIAGASAGVAGVLTGHPLDTLKTRLQAPDSPFKTPLHCMKETIKHEGIRGLYRGLMPPLSTVALSNSITFTVYGKTKSWIPESVTTKEWEKGALGGLASGVVATVIVTPRDLIKSRLQVYKPCDDLITGRTKLLHSASFDCMREVWRYRGFPGMYKGGFVSLARDVPGNAVYFGVYEGLRKMLTPRDKERPPVYALVLSGGCAGVSYWSTIYPLDTVRTVLQVQDMNKPKYRGFWDCTKGIWAEKGFKGFYKGYALSILRSFPISGVNFLIYEAVLKMLEPQ